MTERDRTEAILGAAARDGSTRIARRRRSTATTPLPSKRRPRDAAFRSLSRDLAAAAADHGAHGLVGAEILGAVDIEQRAELRARAVDAALDGADRAAADRRGILIGEAGGADQDQRFALVLRQLVERGAEFLELQMRVLRRLGLQRLGIAAVGILDLAPPLAIVGAEQVAQDREQPRRQVGARAGTSRYWRARAAAFPAPDRRRGRRCR